MYKLQGNKKTPLSVFISYAHEDEPLRLRLEAHLSLLRRQGLIADWHDRQIVPGTRWAEEIDAHLGTASLILLLISPDFLASDYCYDVEMQRALERDKQGKAHVIPLILRPCDWHDAPFGYLQSLPRDGKAVTEWDNQDAALRDIAQGIRRAIEQPTSSARAVSHLSTVDLRNRARLLKRVRSFWINGVLEQSEHHTALITLDLNEQPGMVKNPWKLVMQEAMRPERALPAGTHITQVYDAADGELLILGEPGSGKTTLLLELARDLLDRAEQDLAHPIPVVFNLSSWTGKQPSLVAWLVEELHEKYQVPRKVGQAWIDADQVLLLLDGLDEANRTHYSRCIETINDYHENHDLVPIVVCSRTTEYMAQEARVLLHNAVKIQPLTKQQIDEYLVSTGGQLDTMRMALDRDPYLQELARTPLMLSVLTLTYEGKTVDEIMAVGSREAQQREEVFATYIERMLQRGSTQKRYTPVQTLRWLEWLAKQMVLHSQTEFYIERLQPNWFLSRRSSWLYQGAVRIGIGLVVALIFLLVIGVGYGLFDAFYFVLVTGPQFSQQFPYLHLHPFPHFSLYEVLSLALIGNLPKGLPVVLVIGFIFGLTSWVKKEIKPAEVIAWSWRPLWQSLVRTVTLRSALVSGLIMGLVIGLVFGLFSGLINGLIFWLIIKLVGRRTARWIERVLTRKHGSGRLVVGLISGLMVGLTYVLVTGLLSWLVNHKIIDLDFSLIFGVLGWLTGGLAIGLTYRLEAERKPVRENLWRRLIKTEWLRNTLIFWSAIWLVTALAILEVSGQNSWPFILIYILIVGGTYVLPGILGFALLSWLIGGLSSETLDEHILATPNQGIRRSAQNSIFAGVGFGLVGILIFFVLTSVLTSKLPSEPSLEPALFFGLISGLFIGLANGGIACIQHGVLRLFLWRVGYAPWNYPRFLDYATDRILLRRVGGGYIFIHRFLLDYFASLEKKES